MPSELLKIQRRATARVVGVSDEYVDFYVATGCRSPEEAPPESGEVVSPATGAMGAAIHAAHEQRAHAEIETIELPA